MKTILLFLFHLPLFMNAQSDSISTILQSRINHSGHQNIHNILFYLEKPETGLLFHEGFGLTDEKGDIVSKNAQFKIASVTKPFVATIIMQLVENGKIQLNDKVYKYLRHLDFLDLENIHIYKTEHFTHSITIEHLLSHRSGLADIFNDKGSHFLKEAFLNPNLQYSPKTIVEKYYEYQLNEQAHFKPGMDFFYSDMNSVLLGLLIQEIEQIPLAQSIRTRILEPLNMTNTYLEFYEPARKGIQQVHQYIEYSDMTTINTSFDWAGGGLISTTSDLAVFIKFLFNGQLINHASLQKMTSMKETQEANIHYGLGLYESKYSGDTYYGHYGFYGSYLGYCPDKKIVMVYNISQTNTSFNVAEMINEISKF